MTMSHISRARGISSGRDQVRSYLEAVVMISASLSPP